MNGLAQVHSTIKTASGIYYDFINPVIESININDIAIGLSKICRFGGQLPGDTFYTVAEHSVLCVGLAVQDGVSDDSVLKAILLHDASEAYCGDVVKPLKNLVGDAYVEIEKLTEKVIGLRFGVDFEKNHRIIKRYDMQMLMAEKRFLFNCKSDELWIGEEQVRFRSPKIGPLTCRESYELFIKVFNILD